LPTSSKLASQIYTVTGADPSEPPKNESGKNDAPETARRIAANIAEQPDLLGRPQHQNTRLVTPITFQGAAVRHNHNIKADLGGFPSPPTPAAVS